LPSASRRYQCGPQSSSFIRIGVSVEGGAGKCQYASLAK
jgi:hypothetical protein